MARTKSVRPSTFRGSRSTRKIHKPSRYRRSYLNSVRRARMRPITVTSMPAYVPSRSRGITMTNINMATGQSTRLSLHRSAKNKKISSASIVSVPSISRSATAKKSRSPAQKVAALLTRIRAIHGPTGSEELRKILSKIKNKKVLPPERRAEILDKINKRAVIRQPGRIASAAEKKAFEGEVDDLAAMFGVRLGVSDLSRIEENNSNNEND